MYSNTSNPSTLPNVTIMVASGSNMREPLRETLWELAIKRPGWIFKVSTYDHVDVFCDGMKLGKLGDKYTRNGRAVTIHSHKIGTRRGSRYTSDAKKAVAIAIANFAAKTDAERMSEAVGHARQKVYTINNEASYALRRMDNELEDHMHDFAMKKNRETFTQYVEENGTGAEKAAIANYDACEMHMLATEKLYQSVGNTDGVCIVLALGGGKYMVKHKDAAVLYTDETLPYVVRMRLGMLKLTEEGKALDGIGVKTTTDVFVLVCTDEEMK